jgi:hypothetical protein
MAPLHASSGVNAPPAHSAVRQIALRGLALRLIVAVALHFMGSDATFAPDQETYHQGGLELARYWGGETAVPPWFLRQTGRNGYFFIVAVEYFLFGAWPLLPKIVNAAAGALAVPLVFEVGNRVTGNVSAGLTAARYVAYFPSLVLWSALNIRDVWVVLLILLICREAMRLQERVRLRSILLLAGAILTIVQFRDYIFFALVVPVLLSFVVRVRGNLGRNAVVGLLIALTAVAADRMISRRARPLDLETLNEIRAGTAMVGQSYEPGVDISTPGAALLFLPKGLAFFLLGPFPWTVANVRQAFTVPEMLFVYALVPAILRGIVFLVRHRLRDALMVLLMTAAVTLGYALGQANQGTAYRHRAQVLPFYLMFGAMGVQLRRSPRSASWPNPSMAGFPAKKGL